MNNISVMIVDDDPFTCDGLRANLEASGSNIVVSTVCHDPDECRAMLEPDPPDVALIDLSIYGDQEVGLKVLEEITACTTHTKCMIFQSTDLAGRYLFPALKLGARGYYLKGNMQGDKLAEAVERLARNEWVLDPVFQIAPDAETFAAPSGREDQIRSLSDLGLSQREFEILSYVQQGLTNEDIAKKLLIATPTVKQHLQNAVTKYEAATRSRDAMTPRQLATYLATKGFLSPR